VVLGLVRAGALIAALCLLFVAVRRRERTLAMLRRFWLEPSSPVNVAVLRIIVFYLLHRSAIGQNPVWYTRLPESQRNPPWGWAWLGNLPFDEQLLSGAEHALIVSAAAASLGLFTRVSAPVSALLAVYVLGVPNFFWKINHGHHIRVLCALAIACAPCGDALSLDRLWKRFRGHAPPEASAAYTVPVRVAWLLVGTAYFFPGLWKLWESGDLWITGRQIKSILYRTWAGRPDYEPAFRIDEHDWLLASLGIATIAFEIGFMFCLFNRTARTMAALSAVGFHYAVSSFMSISFSPYFPLIVLIEIPERWNAVQRHVPRRLLDAAARTSERLEQGAQGVFARLSRRVSSTPWPRRRVWPGLLGGAILLLGQTYTGLVPISSWPMSTFPLFSARAQKLTKVGSKLRFYLEPEHGERVGVEDRVGRMGGTRIKRLFKKLETATRSDDDDEIRSVVEVLEAAGLRLEPKDRIAIYEATWDVLPPGERTNYRETLVRRLVVTDDGSLKLERPAKKRPKTPSQ
jgi:hypothetical protein